MRALMPGTRKLSASSGKTSMPALRARRITRRDRAVDDQVGRLRREHEVTELAGPRRAVRQAVEEPDLADAVFEARLGDVGGDADLRDLLDVRARRERGHEIDAVALGEEVLAAARAKTLEGLGVVSDLDERDALAGHPQPIDPGSNGR
jgi:hypothetical protein